MRVLLLDFGMETATNLTIKYIGLGYEMFWTQDSRILAISISPSCKQSLIYNCLYICENKRRGTVWRCSACNGDVPVSPALSTLFDECLLTIIMSAVAFS